MLIFSNLITYWTYIQFSQINELIYIATKMLLNGEPFLKLQYRLNNFWRKVQGNFHFLLYTCIIPVIRLFLCEVHFISIHMADAICVVSFLSCLVVSLSTVFPYLFTTSNFEMCIAAITDKVDGLKQLVPKFWCLFNDDVQQQTCMQCNISFMYLMWGSYIFFFHLLLYEVLQADGHKIFSLETGVMACKLRRAVCLLV